MKKFFKCSNCFLYKNAEKRESIKEKVINEQFKSCDICGNLKECIKQLTTWILDWNTTSEIDDKDLDEMLQLILEQNRIKK